MQVAGKCASLVLLNLQQSRRQRSPRRVGAGKILREVVDGIGDVVELSGAEARQAKRVVPLLQLAQSLNDRARRHQRVADHEGGENGNAAGQRACDRRDHRDPPPGLAKRGVGLGNGHDAPRILVA